MYFGGSSLLAGATGSQFDNIQIFTKALTLEQITKLALANEGEAAFNKPKSTILFDESLILAIDFEQEKIDRTIYDASCNSNIGIVVDEHPPTFVAYDEATTVVKPYT